MVLEMTLGIKLRAEHKRHLTLPAMLRATAVGVVVKGYCVNLPPHLLRIRQSKVRPQAGSGIMAKPRSVMA